MKIVVISPTYNEKQNMEKMIPLLEKDVFPKVKNHDMFLLIADDTSPDGTGDVVRGYMKQWKNIDLLEGERHGLGDAYIRAMQYAIDVMHANAVIEFDADFQHDPHDIPRLVAAMDSGADYVIGSRYVKGGAIPKEWGLDRKVKSILGSLFARVVLFTFAIHDMTSGFKLTKTSFLRKVDLDHLVSRNYAYKLQILYEVVKLGAKVKEVPIIFYERTKGKSKMDTNDMVESFLLVLRLRIRDSKRVIKFLIVGGSGFIAQIVAQELSVQLGVAYSLALYLSPVVFAVTNHHGLSPLRDSVAGGIGAEFAILLNFTLNNLWTFRDTARIKQRSNVVFRLLKFNFTSLAAIFIQAASIWIFVRLLGSTLQFGTIVIPTRILVVIPTIIFIIVPLNYLIYNKIIWKTQYLKNGKTQEV